jgi:hypothetical protein
MAHIIKPPHPIDLNSDLPTIFLAGSIEMGQATNWQAEFEIGAVKARIKG